MPALADAFPALYRPLLGRTFDVHIPAETKATCGSCAMLEGSCGARVAPVDGVPRFFRPDTKCCTFHPRLPNYLVGAILADGAPEGEEGRRRIAERVEQGDGVTPQWLHPPRLHQALYDGSRGAFGRAGALRCPFYATGSGGCTIWAHRDAVCSTWFCKYVAGEDGRALWARAKEHLSLVEIQLARFALLELFPEALDRPEPPRGGPLGPADLDGAPPSEAERRAAWGRWRGREAELYLAAHARVRALTAEDLERILGLDGVLSRRALERALDAVRAPRVPERLRLSPHATVQWQSDGSVALAGYSEHEALLLPAAAYRLLARLTGDEPLARVRERWREEEHADLADEVLLELWRQRVVVEVA